MKRIQSLPGASSINFKPCKTSVSDRHNERSMLDQMNSNIDPALADENRVIRFSDMSLKDYEKMVIADYNEYHREYPSPHNYYDRHKKMTVAGFRKETWKDNMVAVKEGVAVNLPDNSDETLAQLKTLAERLEQEYGIVPLRIFLHADEHRIDPETNEDKYNLHAHMVFGWYDWKTHRPVAINPDQMCRVQDLTAEILGLERGNRTGKHGRKHLDNDVYKRYMDIIAVEDRRKITAFRDVDGLLSRLKEYVDALSYADEDVLESSMSTADHILLTSYIEEPQSITEEARDWVVDVMHPIAYRNCINRLEGKVKDLRRITYDVERYYFKYLERMEMLTYAKVEDNRKKIVDQAAEYENRELDLSEMNKQIAVMRTKMLAHDQELLIGKNIRNVTLAGICRVLNSVARMNGCKNYSFRESSMSPSGDIHCLCCTPGKRMFSLIFNKDGNVQMERKKHLAMVFEERNPCVQMAMRYGLIKPAGKNGVVMGEKLIRFLSDLAESKVSTIPDDVDRDEIDRDERKPRSKGIHF